PPPQESTLFPYTTLFRSHIQDLQPDAAAKLGMVRNRLVLNALYRAEDRLYRSATLVSALDEMMCTTIVKKGVPQTKVVVFPNWVDQKSTSLNSSHLVISY